MDSKREHFIRGATVNDAAQIQKIINFYAEKGKVIPKSLSELYEGIRDYFVYQKGRRILGVCCLKVYWKDLAEICSLAVRKKDGGRGIGTALLKVVLEEAKRLGIKKVFALTFIPEFFVKRGFSLIEKDNLPQKIWRDCVKCVKFPICAEVAVIMDMDSGKKLNVAGKKSGSSGK